MSSTQKKRILVVDDDPSWLEAIRLILGDKYDLTLKTDLAGAESSAWQNIFSLAILDQRLAPDFSGIDLLGRLRAIQPDLPTIILTGHAALEDAVESIKFGAADYISKGTQDLMTCLATHVEKLVKEPTPDEQRSPWERWLAGTGTADSPPLLANGSCPCLKVKSIRLRDIRVFEDSGVVEIPSEIALVLGDNAAGKSTLLRSIALAALGPELANQVGQRHSSYLRQGAKKGFIEVLFELYAKAGSEETSGQFCVGLEIREGETSFRAMENNDLTLGLRNAGPRLDELRRLQQDNFGFFCAYGGLRTFADPSQSAAIPDTEVKDRVASLFDPHAPVIDPDLLSRTLTGEIDSYGIAKSVLPGALEAMRKHLRDLLPFSGDLDSESCASIPLHDSAGVPIRDLSDGYASLLAMSGHLFRHALQSAGWTGDPASVKGFVLIDEIDAHLHPSWQRRILLDLRECFPNLQIIATTHSPMVAGSTSNNAVRLLKRVEGRVRVLSELSSVDGWRADQILTSVLFDLPTTRNRETEILFKRYADRLAEAGPEDEEVRLLGPRVAKALEIEGEGIVDRETHELLDHYLLERLKSLDENTRRLVLAKAGLVVGGSS